MFKNKIKILDKIWEIISNLHTNYSFETDKHVSVAEFRAETMRSKACPGKHAGSKREAETSELCAASKLISKCDTI